MTAFHLPPMLTVPAWEARMRTGPLTARGRWTRRVVRGGLRLDFSRVEFADFAALARALLLLDAAIRDGIQVEVVLPTAALTGELEPDARLAPARVRRARRRGDVRAYMRQVGFEDALRPTHWNPDLVSIGESGPHDPDRLPTPGTTAPARVDDEVYRPRSVLRLRWIAVSDSADVADTQQFAVSALHDIGLPTSDARALGHAVIAELVHNTRTHAAVAGSHPPALLGAVLLAPDAYAARRPELPGPVQELADCAISEDSRVLRLVVGDSGVGLAGPRKADPAGPESVADTVRTALTTWPVATDEPHTARGLWRVARLVWTYRGRVTIRSATEMAGKLFGANLMGEEVVEFGLGHSPGTLVEVDILTDTQPPPSLAPAWIDGPAGDDTTVRVVTCAFDAEHGITGADQRHLAAAIRRSLGACDCVVVTISVPDDRGPLSEADIRAVLRRLADANTDAGTDTAAPTAVVVFPTASPRLLDVSAAGLDRDHRAASGGPVLVVSCTGTARWCGGPAAPRYLLQAVTDAGGSLAVDSARAAWARADGTPDGFAPMLAGAGPLVEVDRRLRLRTPLAAVFRAVHRAVGATIEATVSDGGPGVWTGRFRVPTLAVTNRWTDVGRLVRGTVGVGLVAFVLARLAEYCLARTDRPACPAVVAYTPTAPELLAGQLSECLSLGDRCYGLPGDFDLEVLRSHDQVPDGARVLLCTDLVLTENTVRRAIAALARFDAVPVAVVCVVDARRHTGPIEKYNRTIPVLALAVVDIGSGPVADRIVDIDPILYRPVDPGPRSSPPLPIEGSRLLDWCAANPDLLRLGHISRPPAVHFSAYLRVDRLLCDPAAVREIAAALLGTVTQLVAIGPERVQIWFPGRDDDYAGELAALLRRTLVDAGWRVGPCTAVRRGVAGDRWVFPTMLAAACSGQPVVVVDWGAVSASSMQQLIRLAAGAGASRIIAVILLDQMTNQDAAVLLGLRAVATGAADADGPRAVPTSVRFITATSIGGMPAHDCGICASAERYAPETGAAPERLARHAQRLRDIMRARPRDEVMRSMATDLLRVPVSGAEVADYLRWRGLLQQALRSTAGRQSVLRRLASASGGPDSPCWSRDSLIRLLAAERQWVKLPPLRYGQARLLLATLCMSGLAASTAPVWLRMQALMVLAATRPEQLVEQLPELLARVLPEPVLVDHLLLECYLLLRRSQGSPVSSTELRVGLQRCRDLLERNSLPHHETTLREYHHVLAELVVTAKYHERTDRRVDVQSAWAKLREDLIRVVTQHRLEADLLRVRGFVEDLWERPVAPAPDLDPRDDWDGCAAQLVERALVNLPPLRPILAGDYVEDRIGPADQRRVLRLAESDGVAGLQEVSDLLHRLVREPWDPSDPRWRELHAKVLGQINWWHQMFVAAHLPDQLRPAHFVDLIGSAPILLADRVSHLLGACAVDASVEPGQAGRVEVFCPGKLFDQVLGHLVDNARRHRVPGAESRFRVSYRSGPARTVQLVLDNTGSRAATAPGNGLRSCNEKLAPFGGGVAGHPVAGGEWTFRAVVSLARWQGA